MGGADDPRFRVGEEHRRTVGRQNADDEAGCAGDERVGLGAGIGRDGAINGDGIATVHLVDSGDVGVARAEVAGDAGAVLGDVGRQRQPTPARS